MNIEKQAQDCHNLLPLDPETAKAFTDRQARLICNTRWPDTRWYNDKDFCRAYNTAVHLQAKVEELEAIVNKAIAWRKSFVHGRDCVDEGYSVADEAAETALYDAIKAVELNKGGSNG